MGIRIAMLALAVPALVHADPWEQHDGLTVEAAGGAGTYITHAKDMSASHEMTTDPSPLALHLGVGGFVTPNLAISGQLVMSTFFHDVEGNGSFTLDTFTVGPGVQLWMTPSVWVGGGLGLATLTVMSQDMPGVDLSRSGFGFDVRAGYTLPAKTRNTCAISLEATPTWFGGTWITGVSALVGYQFL